MCVFFQVFPKSGKLEHWQVQRGWGRRLSVYIHRIHAGGRPEVDTTRAWHVFLLEKTSKHMPCFSFSILGCTLACFLSGAPQREKLKHYICCCWFSNKTTYHALVFPLWGAPCVYSVYRDWQVRGGTIARTPPSSLAPVSLYTQNTRTDGRTEEDNDGTRRDTTGRTERGYSFRTLGPSL